MNKKIICNAIVALLITAAMLMPIDVKAELVPLNDEEMESITAQAGIAVYTDGIDMDFLADTVALGNLVPNSDSIYLALCNVEMKGRFWMREPLRISINTGPNAFTDKPVTSLDIRMNGVVFQMDRFVVDAIRVGSIPGEGPSFGSLYIGGMHTEISGNISIWSL